MDRRGVIVKRGSGRLKRDCRLVALCEGLKTRGHQWDLGWQGNQMEANKKSKWQWKWHQRQCTYYQIKEETFASILSYETKFSLTPKPNVRAAQQTTDTKRSKVEVHGRDARFLFPQRLYSVVAAGSERIIERPPFFKGPSNRKDWRWNCHQSNRGTGPLTTTLIYLWSTCRFAGGFDKMQHFSNNYIISAKKGRTTLGGLSLCCKRRMV